MASVFLTRRVRTRLGYIAVGLTTVTAAAVVTVPVLAALPGGGTPVERQPASLRAGSGTVSVTAAATSSSAVTPEVHDVRVRDADRPGRPALVAKSDPQQVDGYGVVGATWKGDRPSAMSLEVRTRDAGVWSAWSRLPVHREHRPEAGSAEAAAVRRTGSDPLVVGDVDAVQLRATSASGGAPRGLELNVVDPGESYADAFASGSAQTTFALYTGADKATEATAVGTVRAPKPRIRSRAQWGANERLRSGSPRYSSGFRGAFVHHTVNANGYARSNVPAIIRGIYAYHTQSLGWSDIGYNFLVDRFGRIWEGRYGGVARHVIGAHTLNYNEETFAMSAIGNFDISSGNPNRRIVSAYGRLFAWKLGLDRIRARSHQWLNGRWMPAINGHRDAGQTACPGRYLYAKLPAIRRAAARAQNQDPP